MKQYVFLNSKTVYPLKLVKTYFSVYLEIKYANVLMLHVCLNKKKIVKLFSCEQ